jgi:hypothetical protein
MVNNTLYGGVSFFILIFSIFMIIKLIEVIDWSWWWGTSFKPVVMSSPQPPVVMSAPQPTIFEDEQDCKLRYISKGVHENKIIVTKSPSIVIWSLSCKCLVGGRNQPPSLEVIPSSDGNYIATYENNRYISLQIRTTLTEEMVREINESDGIVASCAHYGEPYFRYNFIPNK